MSTSDNFYLDELDPNKSCLLAMRTILLASDKDVSETRKYGMPCFLYKGKMFCYLWIDKKTKEPYFLFVEGKQLHYPELETGDRARMKILRINPNKDLPIELITNIIQDAINLYRNGEISTQ